MDLAKTLFDIRTRHGLSQDEFAKMLFVSRDLISKWEQGVRRPDWSMIEKIADTFNISENEIVDKNELVFHELSKCLPDHCTLSSAEIVSCLNSFLKDLDESEANIFICRYYFLNSNAEIALTFRKKKTT